MQQCLLVIVNRAMRGKRAIAEKCKRLFGGLTTFAHCFSNSTLPSGFTLAIVIDVLAGVCSGCATALELFSDPSVFVAICTAPAGASATSLISSAVSTSRKREPRDCNKSVAGPSKLRKSYSHSQHLGNSCPQACSHSPCHPGWSFASTCAESATHLPRLCRLTWRACCEEIVYLVANSRMRGPGVERNST